MMKTKTRKKSDVRPSRDGRMPFGRAASLALGLGLCLSASGETIHCNPGASDANADSSFNTGNCWPDEKAPTKGNDYVWDSKGTFRTPQTSSGAVTYEFQGDSLTFESGSMALKTTNPKATAETAMNLVVFPNLIVSGPLTIQHSGNPNTLARVDGKIHANASFWVVSTVGTATEAFRDMAFLADISGDAAVSVTVSQAKAYDFEVCPNVVRLQGDNGGYRGKWNVKNFEASNVRESMVLSVESPTALGDEPESLLEDAVVLQNNGALAVAASLCADGPFAPRNRGVRLGAVAGRLTTISNESWSTALPISGPGRLVKSGAGRVTLCGVYAAGEMVVESGTLALGAGFSAPDGMPAVTMSEGAAFEVSSSLGSVDLTGLAVPSGALFVVTPGVPIVVGNGATLPEGPIRVAMSAPLDESFEAGTYELMRVHSSVRNLTVGDVELVSTAGLGLRRFELSVEDGAAGQRVLVAKVCPLVKVSAEAKGDNGKWWLNTVAAEGVYLWEDQQAARAGFDYLIDQNLSLRTANGVASRGAFEFAGESLALSAGSLALKSEMVTFRDLRLGPKTSVVASGYTSGAQMQTLAGRLTAVGAFGTGAVVLSAMRTQGIDLAAACAGSGTLRLAAYGTSAVDSRTNVWVKLSGDNSSFRGRLEIASAYGDAETLGVTCVVRDGKSLGGEMATFQADGIRVTDNSAIRAEASFALEAKNRGLYVGLGRLDVVKGVELTVRNPLSVADVLYKDGPGCLVLDGSVSTRPEGGLVIREGGLRIARGGVCEGVALTVEATGSLVLDPNATDEAVRTDGFTFGDGGALSIPDGILPVALDLRGEAAPNEGRFSVPICTLDATTAERVRGRIVVRLKGFLCVVREEALADSRIRFWADVAPKGLAVIIR